jgi:hypothetical protein
MPANRQIGLDLAAFETTKEGNSNIKKRPRRNHQNPN